MAISLHNMLYWHIQLLITLARHACNGPLHVLTVEGTGKRHACHDLSTFMGIHHHICAWYYVSCNSP